MYPILITIGPISIKTYGLLLAVGFLAALWYLHAHAPRVGIARSTVIDAGFWALIGGLVGARGAYVALDWQYFARDPVAIWRVWEGGLVFFGGLCGGVVAAWFIVRRQRDVSWKRVFDLAAPALALAHAIGRVGCFFAGCCYGTETGLPIGVVYRDPACFAPLGVRVLPTQLIEAAALLVLFWVLHRQLLRPGAPGLRAVGYVWGYATIRFCVEFLRGDYRGATIAGLSALQIVALGLWIVASVVLLAERYRTRGLS